MKKLKDGSVVREGSNINEKFAFLITSINIIKKYIDYIRGLCMARN